MTTAFFSLVSMAAAPAAVVAAMVAEGIWAIEETAEGSAETGRLGERGEDEEVGRRRSGVNRWSWTANGTGVPEF